MLPWTKVQTQEHGSYRSGDMVEALGWILPDATGSYESIVVLLDWYSGHLTDEVAASVCLLRPGMAKVRCAAHHPRHAMWAPLSEHARFADRLHNNAITLPPKKWWRHCKSNADAGAQRLYVTNMHT